MDTINKIIENGQEIEPVYKKKRGIVLLRDMDRRTRLRESLFLGEESGRNSRRRKDTRQRENAESLFWEHLRIHLAALTGWSGL